MFSPGGIYEHGRLFSSIEEKSTSTSIADCQAKRTANDYLVLTIGPHSAQAQELHDGASFALRLFTRPIGASDRSSVSWTNIERGNRRDGSFSR
jgi:hypothetical protein